MPNEPSAKEMSEMAGNVKRRPFAVPFKAYSENVDLKNLQFREENFVNVSCLQQTIRSARI